LSQNIATAAFAYPFVSLLLDEVGVADAKADERLVLVVAGDGEADSGVGFGEGGADDSSEVHII
jgi:hypothetical protein